MEYEFCRILPQTLRRTPALQLPLFLQVRLGQFHIYRLDTLAKEVIQYRMKEGFQLLD